MKDSSQVCSHEGSLRARMNELLTELQTIHLKSFENFLENVWNRLFAIVSARVSNSQGNKKIDFRGICSDEIELLTCDAISLQFSSVIQNSPLQVHHHCILTEVVKNIRKMILRQHEGTVNCEQMEQEQMEGIAMQGANKNCYGKVRYVSGWFVAKLIHCHKSYIQKNLCSSNIQVRAEMNRRFNLISMLEGLLVNSSTIHASTLYTQSLEVIDQKQFRENALAYVNDETFEFFIELEGKFP